MSMKMAIIAGDYTNGWSDAVVVQAVSRIKSVDALNANREFVAKIMTQHLNETLATLEGNDQLNPIPLDEPCCTNFTAWAKGLDKETTCILCPYCGTKISDERRKKYVGKEILG